MTKQPKSNKNISGLHQKSASETKNGFSEKEAYSFLNISEKCLKKFCRARCITPIRIGRTKIYRRQDIESILVECLLIQIVTVESLKNNKILDVSYLYCEALQAFYNEALEELSLRYEHTDKGDFNRLFQKAFIRFTKALYNDDRYLSCIN